MSTVVVKRNPDSPEPLDSNKPKQASRSVSLLTPEQLQRKRAQDRESQRQTRARVKQTIAELEKRVEILTQELQLTRLENASLQQRNQLAPPGTIPQLAPPGPVPGPEDFPAGTAAIMDVVVRNDQQPQHCMGMGAQFSDSMVVADPGRQALLDPSLFYPYDDFEQQPLSIPVWDAKPVHFPATCRFDKICLEMIQTLKPLNAIGGTALEFNSPKFPHVQALLNPQHHATSFPLTSSIVQNIIYVLTVESLPEQIAIMYVMCSMIRWIITGREADYYAMPDYLRPTAAQIVTAHPAWLDMMPWPKSRDRLCRDAQYHDKYEDFKNCCNETISINWPYDAADTLIRTSANDFTINPVFITHIRTYSNWTLGPSFLEKYPDFEGEVNIGKPRTIRHR
ncbi:hypothetical protein L207DRAFT_175622 [Hyaloscypha variabilis F]|uniref:BZIP domain-containing protein n=1 Tax=Hyaloscypha variabilis (strain UAMH 11265 / GT02V1 / F) TaxID=1149755 RepID=A0A2J6R3P1_HYAVF|nr:hypothetical protein L207DRAFT_175622 [Hyaloscypha variabilis F]